MLPEWSVAAQLVTLNPELAAFLRSLLPGEWYSCGRLCFFSVDGKKFAVYEKRGKEWIFCNNIEVGETCSS